jgi:uracil-DNA glycosylase
VVTAPGTGHPNDRADASTPVAEWQLLTAVRSVVVLGAFGWAALWPVLRAAGEPVPPRVPAFRHGVEVVLDSGLAVLGCFHVSQQNTFTGRLTEPMLDAVLRRAVELAEG